MIFVITTNDKFNNPHHLTITRFGRFYLYHDDDWTIDDNTAEKGTTNNFCRIVFGKNTITISHNDQRDFPIWYDSESCSNAYEFDNYLPSDAKINYDHRWHVTYSDNDWKESGETLGQEQALSLIKTVLIDNVKRFAESNTLPVVAPDSDGIDTLLVRSVFDYLGVDYTLFDLENKHTSLQTFLGERFYGFDQVQDFDSPTCLLSGFYGDEYLLRSPSQTQMLIDQDIVSLFDDTKHSYMKLFFNQVYREKCRKITKVPKRQLKQMIYNDIQVWHSNRTYVFTPFKDARLLRLLDCDQEVIISQQIHCNISKELIQHFNPVLSARIGDQKNVNEPDWFEKFDTNIA
jgi:hypothetical protein